MTSIDSIKAEYPIHYLVWQNEAKELDKAIQEQKHDINKLDPRGRTPLFLAVRLCHLDCIKVLLTAKCNANIECDGWSIVQEAVCSGDPEILATVLEVRDLQRHIQRVSHVPELLKALLLAPDFYVEMKWEFTSWVPLMSRICPSDTYKVYKRGSNVRIDTTLLGFDNTNWQRGNRSYVFKGDNDEATMIEIDHDMHEVSVEHLRSVSNDIQGIRPSKESINFRLQAPVISNNIDMEKISFERNKSGFWGWRGETMEDINGYNCKVYCASNVEFITRTRTEHLNEEQSRIKNSRTPLQHFLGISETDFDHSPKSPSSPSGEEPGAARSDLTPEPSSPSGSAGPSDGERAVTLLEYFSGADLGERDIGRPRRVTNKVQKFKAKLWLSEEFPIKLQEQVLPILDLMSTLASPHINKLKDFITMQLPSGFPVKIEIPLFHVLNAVVTFSNVFGIDNPIPQVTKLEENDRISCVIEDSVFDIPASYTRTGGEYRRQATFEDEDELMQFAIQQSLIDGGSENDEVDIWEALKAQRPISPGYFGDDDAQLQRALEASLMSSRQQIVSNGGSNHIMPAAAAAPIPPELDDDGLSLALRLSREEAWRQEEELRREREMIEEAIRLSLQEK